MMLKDLAKMICIITTVSIITYIIYYWLINSVDSNDLKQGETGKHVTNVTNVKEGFMFLPDLVLNNLTPTPTITGKDLPTEISYQIPIPANQLQDTQLRDIDTDILRNVRVLANFSKTDELDFYQMYTIIKYLNGGSYTFTFDASAIGNPAQLISSQNIIELSSGAIKNVNLELYTRIKLELISVLNKVIIENGFFTKYHDYSFFKIIGNNLISTENKGKLDGSSGVQNWIFSLKIGREYKFIQYTLYFDIDVIRSDPSSNSYTNNSYTINVNKVEVLGTPIPNDTVFHNNQKTTDTPELAQDTAKLNIDVMPYGEGMFQTANTKFIDPVEVADMSPSYFDNDSLSAKVEDRIMALSQDVYVNSHKCFSLVNGKSAELPYYKWPAFCESYHPEVNQNGIWDAPCQIDADCPFYKANKNYPNEFGKCDKETGKCQMPQGVIPLGFTQYAKQEPDCYNCGIDSVSNKCCAKQAADITAGISQSKSPDYIFANDFQVRKQNVSHIEANGLKVNPSI